MYEVWWLLNYRWHKWRQFRAMKTMLVHENIIRRMREFPEATGIQVRMGCEKDQGPKEVS